MATNINGLFPGTLLPTTTVGGCIDIFENAWPNPKETIASLEETCSNSASEAIWLRAVTKGGGKFNELRTNYTLNIRYSLKTSELLGQSS